MTKNQRKNLNTILGATSARWNVIEALKLLQTARDLLTPIAPQSARKVRSALKSTEGALRNANRRLNVANAAPRITL